MIRRRDLTGHGRLGNGQALTGMDDRRERECIRLEQGRNADAESAGDHRQAVAGAHGVGRFAVRTRRSTRRCLGVGGRSRRFGSAREGDRLAGVDDAVHAQAAGADQSAEADAGSLCDRPEAIAGTDGHPATVGGCRTKAGRLSRDRERLSRMDRAGDRQAVGTGQLPDRNVVLLRDEPQAVAGPDRVGGRLFGDNEWCCPDCHHQCRHRDRRAHRD